MNIHIKNTKLVNLLKESTLLSIEIGSKMYGTNNEHSDTDILNIYKTSNLELNSILNSHHQIQYKNNNIDYIFVNLHTFLRNLLSGDSTINFEVVNSDKLIGTSLEFLYNIREKFNTYKVMRSYLGFGRRDLKQLYKCNEEHDKNKKLFHAYRCWKSVNDIYNNIFTSIMDDKKSIEMFNIIMNINDYKTRIKYIDDLKIKINYLRDIINKDYNDGNLINYLDTNIQSYIDKEILNIMNSNNIKKMKFKREDMFYFYDAQENGISY